MKPTNEELKAAIEVGLDAIISRADGEESGDPGYERSAAILRAHLETFDEELAFLEAAMGYCLNIGGDFLSLRFGPEMMAAYRTLVAKREGK